MTNRDDEVERLRAALEAAQIGVWDWEPESGRTFWSAECRRLLGLPGGEPSYEGLLGALDLEDRERLREAVRRSLDPAGGRDYDVVCRVAAERTRWLLVRGRCSFDPSGRPLRVTGTLADVTERESLRDDARARTRRAEVGGRLLRRLVASEAPEDSLRAVCEETVAALDVTMVTVRAIDEGSGLTSAAYAHGVPEGFTPRPEDPAAREAFLATHGDVAQFPDISTVADFPDRVRMLEMGVRSVAHARMELRGQTVGLLIAVSFGAVRRFDAGDLTFLKSAADVASVALASARVAARYRHIVTTMSEGVVVGDMTRRILFTNAAAARFFGYGPDELVGKSLDEVCFEEDLVARRARTRSLDTDTGPRRETLRYRTKDGREVWGSIVLSRFETPGGQIGSLAIITDVTESRALEAKVQHAQKLESLGVLAGGIAHDFNNLLVGILGNAGLALDDVGWSSPAAVALRDIQVAAMRAADLTGQLLAYAGKGRFVVEPVDLGLLVEETGQLLSALISKRVVVRYDLQPNLPAIEGDGTQLRQVAMSLITNAAEAIGDARGTIVVSTRAVVLDATTLAKTVGDAPLDPGTYVQLEVSDSGVGMSEQMRAKIFDPFFTTKFTGRGLGLAAVLGILRGHRGGIVVESELGRGTTFRALLPAASAKVAPASAPVARPSPMTPAQGLVLVVDDEASVRSVMQRALERAGYRVLSADDGDVGVDLFRAHAREIQVVVLDVTMPRMGGQEALSRMRAIDPGARVVLSSGYSETEATTRFAGQSLSGFLAKPFTTRALVDCVRDVMSAPQRPA